MEGLGAWVRENRNVYFGNAASQRDYRVQLRGSRAPILFGIYLFILIAVALNQYSGVASGETVSIVSAQYQLKNLYSTISVLLAGVVSLVAPALSATSVVIERQRQSLDLVFSAPVTPKYYLVGKMLSSYRYTWMILVLSLPVAAACVVLGGASWVDVLVLYLSLSLHGLVFTAIALLLSTLAPRPVSAIVWSYGAVIAYLFFTGILASLSMVAAFGTRSQEAPFFAAINPFVVSQVVNLHTTLMGVEVPVWTFMLVIAPLVTKLCLLGAGAVISPLPGKEVTGLRIHFLVYLGLISLNIGWTSGTTPSPESKLVWMLMFFAIVMPQISTFGVDGERRYRPNGWFDLRKTLSGTPAGSLPYILCFILAMWSLNVLGGLLGQGVRPTVSSLAYLGYIVGFWFFFWSIGRYISSLFVGLKAARALQFVAFIAIIGLPLPIFANLSMQGAWEASAKIWDFYILRPAFVDSPNVAASYGVLLLILGALLTASSERKIRLKLSPERISHERDLAST